MEQPPAPQSEFCEGILHLIQIQTLNYRYRLHIVAQILLDRPSKGRGSTHEGHFGRGKGTWYLLSQGDPKETKNGTHSTASDSTGARA